MMYQHTCHENLPEREPMTTDGVQGKTSGSKISISHRVTIPIMAIDIDAKCLFRSITLGTANSPEEVQLELLPEPFNWWTEEDHMCLCQNLIYTEGAKFLSNIRKACKPWISVTQPSIWQTKLSNGGQLGMLKHIWLARILDQRPHIR